MVFEHIVAALVHGSGYERIASPGCSDRTIRRRLKMWAAAGIGAQAPALALRAYDQMIGLELGDVAVDGCITKAPCGGDCAGPSPVDRRTGGLKRPVATEGYGIPLGITRGSANSAPMTDRDAAIAVFYLYLAATFVTVRALIQRARRRYRWDTQPTTKRLK